MSKTTKETRILVPVDLDHDSQDALEHALKAALVTSGSVSLLHVHGDGEESDWTAMPTARETLVRWRVLTASAGVADFEALGIRLDMLDLRGRPTTAVPAAAIEQAADLIVMHSSVREGMDRWLSTSTSMSIARNVPMKALLLSARSRSLVEHETGQVNLRHVLLPLGDPEEAQVAIDGAVSFARMLGIERAHGTLLHVGGDLPDVDLPETWTWDTRTESGGVVQHIVEAVEALGPDLVVMATRAHDSLRDALFGSVTDRVAPRVHCPLLVVPTND